MIGYTKVDKRLKEIQVESGTVRYGRACVSGSFNLWRPGFMTVYQDGTPFSKPLPMYHVHWNLKRGMSRPIVWGCPPEMTDFVELLVYKVLDIKKPIVRQVI